MAKVPVIIVQNEDIVWEIASIKLDHIPYHEIESFIRSNKTAYPNRKLLLHLKNLTLPDSEINIDYLKNMKRNRLAFECITALTKDESHFCSMEYYKQLIQPLLKLLDENSLYKNSLDKLNKYMVSKTLAEKNSMLRTITLCLTESTIDLEIFQKYPSIMWRYKILLRALILNDHSWAFTLDRSVIKKINDTIDLLEKQNRSLKIEDIFEYLLRNQKIYKFRVEILIDTLDFISKDENYNIAKYMTNLPIMVQDCDDEIWGVSLEWESTIKLITDYSNSKVISESCDHLQGYQRTRLTNLLLKYSYDMIRYFIDLIKSIDNVEITGVIQLLESLEATKLPTSNIEPFLYCLKSYNSSIWRFKFIFFITLKMISREFPVYETFMMQEELEAESIDEFNSAPKAMQNTKCYRPWGDKLSVSVTTYSNENYNTKRILKGSDKLYHLLHYLHEKLINFIIMITGDEFSKTIKIISGFISNLDSEKKIEKLANCFEIFKDYNVGINNEAILDIFNRSSCEDIEQKIHDFVITSEFPGTQSKSRDEMLQELSNLNNDMDTSHISEILSEKDRHYDSCIKHWRSYHVKEWSSRRSTTPQLGECLGVMKKAMQLTMAVRVRDSHMIAMIIMLNHDNENRGRLSQINEGEGRPIVIALLAAYLAMIGHKVDIATSSPMIAMAQSRTLTPFYEILNLSVDHIIKNPSAYSCDIVYGVHFVYQEDIYRTEYVKTQGRQNRPFDIVIIDQTENMFYNENKKLIRSTALIAGMEQLVPLLARIWVYVDKFEYTNFERNSDNPMRPSVEPNKVTEEHIIEIVSRNMSVHLRDDNRDTTQDEIFEEMKIPNHLREFVVMVGLREWILKAIKAKLYLHNGIHYIIENDLIRILEPNTERIQHDKLWSDGLYQFIAMKHKIKLIPIRLSCHYLSNVGLFCRYPRIYGFTETLGNEYHTRLLNQFYRLDSFIIPTFKQKQHKELSAIVVNQLEDWYATIVDSNMSKIRNGRGVFIITKYIEETHELEKRFQSADRTIKIKLYQTECDLQTIKSSLGPKQIIIATNLEGVSSDTKPDPGMDKNGGIHVCITYLSENSRVRIQNYQRTSREGNRGTSQFIIFDKNGHSIEHLRHIYDLQESSSFDGKFSEMRRMKTKDDTVRNFCQLLDSIDFGNNPRDRDAVEERFVIWQKTHEHILKEGLFDQYGREFEEFGRDISNKRKFINPYLVVLEANGKLLEKLKKYKRINSDKLTKAYDQYSYAIKLDENNVEYAYYNRGVIALSEDNRKIFSIDGIIRDFQRARKIMMSKIDEYDVLLHLAEDGTSLHTQCLRKIKLYSEGIKSIDIVIGYDQQILDDRINACRQIIDSTEDRQEVERRREEIEKLMEKKEIKGKILALADADTKCYMKFLKPPEYLGNDHHLYQEEIDEFASNGWWGPITISDGNRRQLYNMAKCVAIINVQIYLGIVCILWIPPVAHILGPAAFIDAALDIGRLSIRYYKERSLSLRKFFKCKTNSFLLCSMICLFVTYISGI